MSASSMADILLTSVKDVVINQTLASLNAISVILFDDQILNVFRDIITKPQPIQSSQAPTSGPTIPGRCTVEGGVWLLRGCMAVKGVYDC